MHVKSICGIILASENPGTLAEFYASALGLRFAREDHGGLETHYGVDIGECHFGIHPPANLFRNAAGNASASIAFNVDSLDDVRSRLRKLGAVEVAAPHDEGFGLVAAYTDPEGNPFEVVELSYEFGAEET